MSRAVQVGRDTVLAVDPSAGRVLSVTGTGQVRVSDVSKSATVVTEETQGANLSLLKAGDVIRVEAPRGQIQRIVVLRRGWQELESPEK
jgi:phosphohistidine swiveling domain-containing protein